MRDFHPTKYPLGLENNKEKRIINKGEKLNPRHF